MKVEACYQVVIVWGIEVNITPVVINRILGTMDVSTTPFTQLQILPPYTAICHTLAGLTSTAKWIRHRYKRYHQSFIFSHINREARLWIKIIMHLFFLAQHFTNITRDRVCLAYALMTVVELNFGAIFKSYMRKAHAHRRRRYVFGGLITELCSRAGVPEDPLTTSHRLRPQFIM